MAVMSVTLNRVNDSRYPNTICGVVKQGPSRPSWKDETVMIPIKHKCQFSWYCDGLSDTPRNEKAFVRSQEIAQIVLNGWTDTFIDGATHYHADYVMPSWAHTFTKVATIDSHIFYRWD